MKKNVNKLVALTLVMNMMLGFGWFVDVYENMFARKNTLTTFMTDGTARDYVTVYGTSGKIIDEYIVIREIEA